jgi:hypothetical protein
MLLVNIIVDCLYLLCLQIPFAGTAGKYKLRHSLPSRLHVKPDFRKRGDLVEVVVAVRCVEQHHRNAGVGEHLRVLAQHGFIKDAIVPEERLAPIVKPVGAGAPPQRTVGLRQSVRILQEDLGVVERTVMIASRTWELQIVKDTDSAIRTRRPHRIVGR